MILQTLIDIAEICSQKNIHTVIHSPGSRNAVLTIAFARHPDIQLLTVPDERTAAFIALGIAQQKLANYLQNIDNENATLEGVALLCTSGSATLNYYPAIAEAYYLQIPLLVLTADRPPEWIDQQDGQTIHQRNLYQNHIKQSFELPTNPTQPIEQWHAHRILNEAINQAFSSPFAPVHINIPIREPFYPEKDEKITFSKTVRIIHTIQARKQLSKLQINQLLDIWNDTPKKMIIAGQNFPEPALQKTLQAFSQELFVPIVSDIISNYQSIENAVCHHDTFLLQTQNWQRLAPCLLITFGKSLISKSLKQFIRKAKPQHHWHIQADGYVADTFQTLTHHIAAEPKYFLTQFFSDIDYQLFLEQSEDEDNIQFWEAWQQAERKAESYLHNFLSQQIQNQILTDFSATYLLLEHLPDNCTLHLANSMPVRYANYISLKHKTNVVVFANRGISGIDGCTSTAVGMAIAQPQRLHVLLIGDVGFFYDRNAFWHAYLPANLRIVLLNNGGGNIFRLIDAAHLPELEPYFETQQLLNAQYLAQEFGLYYQAVSQVSELVPALQNLWLTQNKPAIVEIFTDKRQNALIFEQFKQSYS
ncbi:MAG: 2-succinyl-5-enolpyruvyl-6-hydroxy-3-cyclohexene-1-carboxylic-acid synthase [Microscillaceae bacterium]|nr:2-succinyl-5-enolpyruvyl-6-hydroxy-3-cyclohexene-1-carboxylic-acid synthase [Microscillaceae bacterium]MDW8461345.1 2-succinyl-5-enolpyruvyl-6-hydroxy-3-cyclohexene-1-carboxylic-acid synthase [Cytophagales bacterium]